MNCRTFLLDCARNLWKGSHLEIKLDQPVIFLIALVIDDVANDIMIVGDCFPNDGLSILKKIDYLEKKHSKGKFLTWVKALREFTTEEDITKFAKLMKEESALTFKDLFVTSPQYKKWDEKIHNEMCKILVRI